MSVTYERNTRNGFRVHIIKATSGDIIKVRRTDDENNLDGAWVEMFSGSDQKHSGEGRCAILSRGQLLDLIDALGKVISEYETGEEW